MNPSYLLVLLGVVMVSYSGPLVKGGLLAGANPVTVATLRMLFSFLLLTTGGGALAVPAAGRR